ncbi:MAG TPA: dihydrofolate reductase family protein [Actinomycetota bacterium]|nr:dihydrofolate reductase family protein [Actinomycetota bacterium]
MSAERFGGFDVLFDSSSGEVLTSGDDAIERLHGGPVRLASDGVYANFVASLDGVAALRDRSRSSADISRGHVGDRFMMGVLRACADAIVVGAGTVRAHPDGRWTPGAAYPAGADDLRALRRSLGVAGHPRLVVVSGGGDLGPAHPGIVDALVVTTGRGARTVPAGHEAQFELAVVAGDDVEVADLLGILRSRGYRRILTEGGPRLMGQLLGADAIGTMFLTVSPVVAGRTDDRARPGMVDGVAFEPTGFREATLTSVRRSRDHLFLRYELSGAS